MLAHALAYPLAFRPPPRLLRRPVMDKPVSETERWNRLVTRLADGDREAFAALFQHFAPRLKAFLMRQGVAASQAEDLAQDAMVSLWRKAQLFDPAKASAATWLFTIARNLRIDAIRRDKRPELDPADPMLSCQPDRAADDGVILAQDETRLRAALKGLPPDQARVIELSFFDDKPHTRIAEELAIPLGTVKSRLRLAMARLRDALDEVTP
jgi:RNA polymerase sigma-70 factor (ECF subfamily)